MLHSLTSVQRFQIYDVRHDVNAQMLLLLFSRQTFSLDEVCAVYYCVYNKYIRLTVDLVSPGKSPRYFDGNFQNKTVVRVVIVGTVIGLYGTKVTQT